MRSGYRKSPRRSLLYLILFSLLLLFSNRFDFSKKIKRPIVNTLSPLLSYVHHVTLQVKGALWALGHFYQLKNGNDALSQENDALKKQLLENQEIRMENKRLTELLGFQSQLNYSVVAARITGKGSSNWSRSVLIDKGLKDGVDLNLAVMCSQGAVGTVVEAFPKSATVMLLIDKNSQVGGLVQRTRDMGVLQGNPDDFCPFNYLSKNAQVIAGDLVVGSGQNSRFPKGVLLGEVVSVKWDRTGLYKMAEVNPAVEFNKLEEVLVVTPAPKTKTP